MASYDDAVMAYQLGGGPAYADQMVANHDYLGGAGSGAADACSSGRASLGILGAAILAVMFFYVATRTRQL